MQKVVNQGRKSLENLDIFGYPIGFIYKQSNTYRTTVGGIASISIIIILALIFQANIITFLRMENVTALQTTDFSAEPTVQQFNDENFMFALQIAQYGSFIKSPIANVTLIQYSATRYKNGTRIKTSQYINLVPCQLKQFQKIYDKFGMNFTQQFNRSKLYDYLCPEEGYTLNISGSFQASNFQYSTIYVSKCKDNYSPNQSLTWQPSCANQTAIQNYLNTEGTSKISVYMTDYIVNPHKPKDFIQSYFADDLYFNFIPDKTTPMVDIFFKSYDITTDRSISPVQDIENLALPVRETNDYREIFRLAQAIHPSYAEINFRRSHFTVNIQRKFQKLDDLASYLGGSIKFFLTFCGIFIIFYNKLQFYIQLSNNIYDFRDSDGESSKDEKQRKQALITKTIQLLKNPKSSVGSQISEIKSRDNENPPFHDQSDAENQKRKRLSYKFGLIKKSIQDNSIKKKEELSRSGIFTAETEFLIQRFKQILKKRKKISLHFFYPIYDLFKLSILSSKQITLLDKAITRVNDDLDIQVVLDKLKEIDKLKALLLSKEQQILFEFSPKPLITLAKDKSEKTESQITQPVISDANEEVHDIQVKAFIKLFKTYQTIFNQMQHGSLDQKDLRININLINQLGDEILTIFQNSMNLSNNLRIKSNHDKDFGLSGLIECKSRNNPIESLHESIQHGQKFSVLSKNIEERDEKSSLSWGNNIDMLSPERDLKSDNKNEIRSILQLSKKS